MILTLVVQYDYDGTIVIAAPCPTQLFDYVGVASGKTLEEAKQKAYEYYNGTDYKLVFINEEGDRV